MKATKFINSEIASDSYYHKVKVSFASHNATNTRIMTFEVNGNYMHFRFSKGDAEKLSKMMLLGFDRQENPTRPELDENMKRIEAFLKKQNENQSELIIESKMNFEK